MERMEVVTMLTANNMIRVSDYLYQKASKNKVPLCGCFELSPVCNFACKMCYVRKTIPQIEKEGKRLKDWKDWLTLAEECKKAGTLYLLLTGGEPFLYPHFKELYTELHKMGFILSINSNGTLIDKETVAWLKTMAPSRINITLYGASAATYKRICGNADGYHRAKEAILMLKEVGIPVVINGSMIPENEMDLEEIIAFGKSLELNTRISTYMFPPVRRNREETDSRFTPEQSAEIWHRKQKCILGDTYYEAMAKELQKVGKPQKLVSEYSDERAEEVWGSNLEYMRCRAGRSSFWVSWEGTMTACGMLPFPIEEYPFENPFYECWQELTNKVRTTKVLKECNKCEKKEICNPCVAMLYAENGTVDCKASYMCALTDCIIETMKCELQELNVGEDERTERNK